MTALAHLLVGRARWVLAATVLLTLVAAAMMPRLAFNADVTSFLLEASEAGRDLAALQAKYAAADPITVLLERSDGGPFTDRAGIVLLARARDALRAVPGVASVGTALPDEVPIVGVATTPDLLAGLPAFAVPPLLNGPGTDLLLADDGRLAMAVVLAADDAVELAGVLRDAELAAGLDATFAGSPMPAGAQGGAQVQLDAANCRVVMAPVAGRERDWLNGAWLIDHHAVASDTPVASYMVCN